MLQSVQKWSDVCDDDCCEHSTSEGTGLQNPTSHNLRSVCWIGMVFRNRMRHCPLRTCIPQSMFMLHTEMPGGQSQKLILRDCCFTFSWYAKRQLCLLIRSCKMEMHKNGCVCVCMCMCTCMHACRWQNESHHYWVPKFTFLYSKTFN